MHIISAADFPLFCSEMSFSAGRMHASKIAYSARNSAGRICPNLVCVCVCVCSLLCACMSEVAPHKVLLNPGTFYFGGARSKGFVTLRTVSKSTFLGQDWARKVCRFAVLFGHLTK